MLSDDASKSKDKLDAYRLTTMAQTYFEFHSLLKDGTQLDINNLPIDFKTRYYIPLHFDSYEENLEVSGTYQIVWDDLRSVPDDWILTLFDNTTGETINLLEEGEYIFNHSTKTKREKVNPLSPDYKIIAKTKSMSTRFTLMISTEQIERDVPMQPFLSQNYPNPFNPSTTINFGLDEQSDVLLEIYDILGRKIQTLINENREPGRYQTYFNARTLASGVYFYRLQANNNVFIKKMTLIK